MDLKRLGKAAVIIMAAALALIASSCSWATESMSSYIVNAEWLKANLGSVVVIDARDQALYKGQQGHIPSAVNAPWTYFAHAQKAGDPKSFTLLPKAELAKKIGALGIDGKKPVIVYGDGGDWGNAAWVIWILRMTGNNNSRILDGGWSAWKAAGGKASNETHAAKAVAYSIDQMKDGYIVTTEWMKEHYNDPSVKVVDVRTPQEYTGQIRPFGERRPGHIPGAVNLNWGEVMNDDFSMMDETALEVKLASFFPDKNQEIILYDTNGVRAAFMTMAFRLADYPNARCYDASYSVWCADPDTEIRQGPNP